MMISSADLLQTDENYERMGAASACEQERAEEDAIMTDFENVSDDSEVSASLTLLDVAAIQKMLEEGEITCVELVMAHLSCIRTLDSDSEGYVGLRAIKSLYGPALETAQALDEERKHGIVRSPLHGIPVLIKEVYDIEGEPISSEAYCELAADIIAPDDASVIAKLRAAGAIILARTNTGRNPYDRTRNSGGSSSGNAAGLAVGYAPIALGEDTGGSTRVPASFTGTVGFRPSAGLVSMDGVMPFSIWADTPGPQSRTVRDCALMMDVIAGYDPSWPGSVYFDIRGSFTQNLCDDFLQGKTVGVFGPNLVSSDQAVIEHFLEEVKGFEAAGARVVVMKSKLTANKKAYAPGTELLWEAASDWNVAGMVTDDSDYSDARQAEDLWLSKLQADDSRLAKVAEPYNKLTWRDKALLTGASLVDCGTKKGRNEHSRKRKQLMEWFKGEATKYGVDFVVYPSTRTTAPKGDAMMRSGNTMISPLLGTPSISVPAGLIYGLPIGMEIMGLTSGSDAEVLGAAYAFEQVMKRRKR